MTSLPSELLEIILASHAKDLSTLYSCTLVNRNWCVVALQYLWAKPFTLLLSRPKGKTSRSVDSLLTTFIECFTDVDILASAAQLYKRYSKRFPFDYSLYLKEIHFREIYSLSIQSTKYYYVRDRIILLAIKYCPNLCTLSLTLNSYFINQSQLLVSVKSLPHLQNLVLYLNAENNIFSTLSAAAQNLKSISVKVCRSAKYKYNLEQGSYNGLQKLVQSQHQLKTITMENVTAKMRTIFKLLEPQSNSLESIILKHVRLLSDESNTKQVKFYQLRRIYIKNCTILKRGLKSILEADLPKLQQLEFENTSWQHNDNSTFLLQNKYQNAHVIHSYT